MTDLLFALALAVLCVAAWQIHRRLRRLETEADERTRISALVWEPDDTVYRFTVPPPGGP